ncbi:MAG TPA: Ig-like domain-containing protein [Steroidobacteraceae bacterium]|nr:Ig-like domain-containing protein [Steroidobacteraceae bacterium]
MFKAAAVALAAALLTGCVGSGAGLDANGNPIGSAPASPPPLTPDFQSIQDNVFTPICTRCHSGADAPEGLQLDAAHSYALLVGVPSAEVPAQLRVKPGDPGDSYLIQKLQGSGGIVGAQTPFGGPYLPQSTIDVIAQWISAGAAPPAGAAAPGMLAVTATMPMDRSAMNAPLTTIAVALNQPPDVSYLNAAVRLQSLGDSTSGIAVAIAPAEGNANTVLLTPVAPLPPGSYRVTLRGGDAWALTAVGGDALPADYSFTFNVDAP